MSAENRRERPPSRSRSAERQTGHTGRQLARVREEEGDVQLPLQRIWIDSAFSTPRAPRIRPMRDISTSFHLAHGVVASRKDRGTTTGAGLRVVLRGHSGVSRTQPGVFGS